MVRLFKMINKKLVSVILYVLFIKQNIPISAMLCKRLHIDIDIFIGIEMARFFNWSIKKKHPVV